MSEVISRPAARGGRGSGRGGRGGFAGRGGRRANGDKADPKSGAEDASGAFDDEGDFAELRKQYGSKTAVIREMFSDWSEVDVLFALQETNGDENEAVTRIAEGSISQWGEVSKTKKKAVPKAKESTTGTPNNEASTGSRPARGGRAVSEGGRGRGRATERGGRGGRARAALPTANGSRQKENQQLSVPTEEAPAWGTEPAKADAQVETIAEQSAPSPEGTAATPQSKTWASMLRQSTVSKAALKPKEAPAPKPAEFTEASPVSEPAAAEPEPTVPEEETTPVAEQAVPALPSVVEPEIALPPSQDELTRTNLEQVVDDSKPAATGTAASTAADSWDPRQNPVSATATPISAAQHQHQTQRPPSGYAAAALKATAERSSRPPSYQRRVLDQEEAVRMPGNREVDRAAVQFGAFNLNGGEEDIDGDREEPETRAQPPAESPVAHPRASLPPVALPPGISEPFQQKPVAAPPGVQVPTGPAAASQVSSQATQPVIPGQQFGRFGQSGPQDVGAAQKPLDPFSQQSAPSSQPPFDNFGSQTSQPPSQQPGGAFTSGPNDYSSYYTANQQDRTPYSYYGQQFGQQGQQGAQGQDGAPSQQRAFGGYNAAQQSDNLSQYPQSGGAHGQPRFGGTGTDSQNSGHNTPNPTTQSQHQQPQPQAAQGAPGSQPSHGQQYPGYQNHPYYSNPYYHQYYSNYAQGNFGPYGKGGGMYGQPYGVSPNAPYEHGSSPASFSQSASHRDSGISSGLGEYSRTGSAQTGGGAPGLGGSSFSSVHDSFSRGSSSFQSQGQGFNSQTQPGPGSSSDDLKPFGDAKTGAGPSPALGGARPGSAANNTSAGQSGLPPPQNSQMGGAYGGYPGHLQGHGGHGNNAYGMGGGAGASQHGNTPYGSYGQQQQGGFGSGNYYGGNQQQQQQQQQRGGWGGNYH